MPNVALLIFEMATVVVPGAAPTDAAKATLLRPVPPPTCLAKADEIVSHLRPDRDQSGGDRREPALEPAEDRGPEWVEVAP